MKRTPKSRLSSRSKPNGNGQGNLHGEDRRSVAVTVAWMMATLATAAALLLFGLAQGLLHIQAAPPGRLNPLAALPGVLLFTAVVTGSLVLLLIPVVYRVRTIAPPRGVTVMAAGVAAGAWIVLLVTAIL